MVLIKPGEANSWDALLETAASAHERAISGRENDQMGGTFLSESPLQVEDERILMDVFHRILKLIQEMRAQFGLIPISLTLQHVYLASRKEWSTYDPAGKYEGFYSASKRLCVLKNNLNEVGGDQGNRVRQLAVLSMVYLQASLSMKVLPKVLQLQFIPDV